MPVVIRLFILLGVVHVMDMIQDAYSVTIDVVSFWEGAKH